jgi:hypothetical protein
MKKIYDNGTMVLGQVNKVREYLIKYNEEEDFIKDIINDLKEEKDDTIVAINYDLGMGYSIDYWDEKDIVK